MSLSKSTDITYTAWTEIYQDGLTLEQKDKFQKQIALVEKFFEDLKADLVEIY